MMGSPPGKSCDRDQIAREGKEHKWMRALGVQAERSGVKQGGGKYAMLFGICQDIHQIGATMEKFRFFGVFLE
jgi:hypothetical protein